MILNSVSFSSDTIPKSEEMPTMVSSEKEKMFTLSRVWIIAAMYVYEAVPRHDVEEPK